MSLDRQPQIEIEKTGRDQLQDLERGFDLGWPADIRPESVVPVAHVDPGVPAPERGDGFELRAEEPGVLGGGDLLAQLATSPDRIGRGKANLQIKTHLAAEGRNAASLAGSSSGSITEGSRNWTPSSPRSRANWRVSWGESPRWAMV